MNEPNNKLRVFIDTNVLISAVISETSPCRNLIRNLIQNHVLILCSYSLTEVSRVLKNKFPGKMTHWDYMLTNMEFELSYTPEDLSMFDAPYIRDPEDLPILISAIIAEPDVFVTGDKDFHTKEIKDYLVVYTPADFLRDFT
ncbi:MULTISPECIES: putative toxin-antitoxin system toxin component, PIN family [Bacillota]|uniref:putative toxin-antitoxin system toxin component, PIN family n=1 Tax=Bacillota TaxID=1239 RepID=UPI0039EF68AF